MNRGIFAKLALAFWFIYSPLAVMAWYELSAGTLLEFLLTYLLGFGVYFCLLLLDKIQRKKPEVVEPEVKHEKEPEEPAPLMRTDVNLNQLDADDDVLG